MTHLLAAGRVSQLRRSSLAMLALGSGALIALLPVQYSAVLLGGGLLLIAAIFEPLVGLSLMIGIGLAEPLLAAAGLLPVPYSQVAFGLFAGAWLLRGLAQHKLGWPQLSITLYFLVYLLACSLSVFFTQPVSPRDAATELWKWLQMYLIAGIVYDAAGRQKLHWVVAIVLGLGLVEAGIGVWQFQFRGHGPDGFKILGDHWRAYGTLEQPNPFGGFMGLVWPMAAMIAASAGIRLISGRVLDRRTLSIFGLGALVAVAALSAMFLSFSRGSWLGAAAAALVMLVFWPRRRSVGLLLAGGSIVALLALYNFGLLPASIANRFADVGDFVQVYDVRGVHINDSNFSIVERLAHWQTALNMTDAYPLFGVGVGNYAPAYPEYRLAAWRYPLGHAHNIYLNVLAETGVAGLLAYLVFWAGIGLITIKVIVRNPPGVSDPTGLNLNRALALGLLGCWCHLATHQLLDNLYVGNIPLYLGALFGILCIVQNRENLDATQSHASLPNF